MIKKWFEPKFRYRKELRPHSFSGIIQTEYVVEERLGFSWHKVATKNTEEDAKAYIDKELSLYREPWTYYP